MNYAPIALFTYNRPDHTQQAVESLLTNAEAKYSDLYIFSDGPKNDKAVEGVKANREYIRSLKAANKKQNQNESHLFKSITIIERDKNWGLANSLIAGITEVINQYERIIVVEDDLVLSPYFLQFMNEALEKYKDEDKVGAVSAYNLTGELKLPETFFLHYFHCWGWGTWKRGWNLMNQNTKDLLRKIRFKTYKFNLDGAMNPYGILYCQKVGLVDSWYIKFYASLFLSNKLTLFPGHSLVLNRGIDGSGTHCTKNTGNSNLDNININDLQKPIIIDNIVIKEDQEIYATISKTIKARSKKMPFLTRNYLRIKSFVRRLFFIDII